MTLTTEASETMGIKVGSQVTGRLQNKAAGQIEFAGTVSNVFQSNGQTLVNITCSDGIERTAQMDNLTPAEPNLQTHTGTVHAPGKYYKALRTKAPKCCASASTVARFHYVIPVSLAVTCQKCLNLLAKESLA